MKGKTHMTSAMLLAPILLKTGIKPSIVPFCIATGIGALLPDIDISNSTISNKIKNIFKKNEIVNNNKILSKMVEIGVLILLIFIMYLLNINQYLTGFIAFLTLNILTSHRSLSHSLLSALIVWYLLKKGLLIYKLDIYANFISLGYLIHILEDMLTPMGVPLLFPIITKKTKIPIVKTNLAEYIFLILVIVLFVYKFI